MQISHSGEETPQALGLGSGAAARSPLTGYALAFWLPDWWSAPPQVPAALIFNSGSPSAAAVVTLGPVAIAYSWLVVRFGPRTSPAAGPLARAIRGPRDGTGTDCCCTPAKGAEFPVKIFLREQPPPEGDSLGLQLRSQIFEVLQRPLKLALAALL
jgi:hypothetical protein